MGTGKKGKRNPGTAPPVALNELLEQHLSREELRRILVTALRLLDEEGRNRLVEQLDDDTGRIVLQLLEDTGSASATSRGRHQHSSGPSNAKIQQEWSRAWSDWDGCLSESNDEGGRYIFQEHHWEQPFLDVSKLADDLEAIAARVLVLVPRVVEDNLDPGFSMVDVLAQGIEDIGAELPEWFGEPECVGLLGPTATTCLLHWEWRSALRSAKCGAEEVAFAVIDYVRRVEAATHKWGVDSRALLEFVCELDGAAQRAIHTGIAEHQSEEHWRDVLSQPSSGWFALQKELTRRWAVHADVGHVVTGFPRVLRLISVGGSGSAPGRTPRRVDRRIGCRAAAASAGGGSTGRPSRTVTPTSERAEASARLATVAFDGDGQLPADDEGRVQYAVVTVRLQDRRAVEVVRMSFFQWRAQADGTLDRRHYMQLMATAIEAAFGGWLSRRHLPGS